MIILENGKIGKKNNRGKVKFGCGLLLYRVGTFGTESAVRKRWQQEFAVFKCEATANSVTGHMRVQ